MVTLLLVVGEPYQMGRAQLNDRLIHRAPLLELLSLRVAVDAGHTLRVDHQKNPAWHAGRCPAAL
jgi:hypothetical protein